MKILTKLINKIKSLDFLFLTFSTVACSAMSFVFNVYTKRIVPEEPMGISSLSLMIVAYLNYAQLGVLNAYNRDYPQALGRKDYADAQKQRNIAITFMLMMYTLIFVVFEAWVFLKFNGKFGSDQMTTYRAYGYALCPIMIFLKSFDDMANNTVRMKGFYNKSAIIGFLRTVLAFAIGFVCVNRFGYYGLYAMTIASALFGILFFYKDAYKGAKLDFDFKYMKMMVVGGIPLLINSLIWTMVQNVDKHVIITFFKNLPKTTDAYLGIYTVANMGFSTMVLIPMTIGQVFYIKIGRMYGAGATKEELLKKSSLFTSLTAAISGAACIMVLYILPIFVQIVMPKYTAGTTAAQILIVGVAIYSTTIIFGQIFSVLKLNKSLIANSVALCIFNVIFSLALVLFVGRSLNMVALGTGISYALYSLLLMVKLSMKFKYSFLKLITASWLPLLAIVIPGIVFYLVCDSIYVAAGLALFTAVVVCGIITRLYFRVRG
ncbi:MAG: oligosaccharide flippase family protein [Pseudobutyrivibrio sp.]|nr:oligosaccharide flippase family protein [Pseudobutyrivibrio sp.]